jgi:6-phosphogluconolactonase
LVVHLIAQDPAGVARLGAEWIAKAVRTAVTGTGGCTLALAGGGTPRECYTLLAALPHIPWDRAEIFFGDERAVPPDAPESNYRMVLEALLSRLPVPPARVHRMEAERGDLERAADDYAARLPESLDILLLGIGADGHTASLFPHGAAVAEQRRRVVPATGGEPLVPRLTITPPVVDAARQILVMAAGAEKAVAVAGALEGAFDPSAVPAQLARRGTWILDRAAAGRLGHPSTPEPRP